MSRHPKQLPQDRKPKQATPSHEQGRVILEIPRVPRMGWFVQAKPLKARRSELKWQRAALSDDSDWEWK